MVSASIMASPNHNTSFNAMLKRCLALPPVARSCQTQTKKSPQLRGLSGISCHQVPGCARRGIIPTPTSILLDTIEGGHHTDFRVYKGKLMFIFSEEKWTHGGNILIGSSRDGVKEECGYPPMEPDEHGVGWCYKNTGEMSVLDVFKNGFPAIFVTRTGTTAGQNSPVPAENLIYTFIDGRYQ